MTTAARVSLVLFAVGCAITAIGVGLYEAWWTIAFAVGGALVGAVGPRLTSPGRSIAIGTTASGAALLIGMSAFFLFGTSISGSLAWLAAAVGSILGAIVLVLVARRLLTAPARPNDGP
jgi:hypothetical protein